MNFGYGPVSDMARELLSMKQFDRARAGLAGLGGAGAGAGMPGGAGASPRAGGIGGGGTAKSNDAEWEAYRAESQAKREAAQKASDAEWSGMMADATKKTNAFNAAGAKEWSANEALKSGSSTTSTSSAAAATAPSPSGVVGGSNAPTDQNGGTQAQSSGPSESSGSSSGDEEEKEDEDQGQGFDVASDDSGGEPRATGGPVRAGGLYRVAEGNKPEVYVQNDGDVYPLTRETSMRPRENGVIVPNPQAAKFYRASLGGSSPANRVSSVRSQGLSGGARYQPNPANVAAIRAGKKHPRYTQAVLDEEVSKNEFYTEQQSAKEQKEADRESKQEAKEAAREAKQQASEYRQELDRRRSEIDRRAKSGAIDALPEHYWTQDERAAMAPILAERKAREAQQTATVAAKNPYRARLNQMQPDAQETDRMRRLAELQSDPRTKQDLLNRAEMRSRGMGQVAAMADAVDAANDPYVKIKNEEAKAQQAAQKEARSQQQAAAGRVAELYNGAADFGSPEANAQAGAIAKSYRQGLVQQAGGGRVAMPQSAGAGPAEAPSARAQGLTQPPAQAQSQRPASQAQGNTSPPATPPAGSKPATAATPPPADKPDDIFKVAWSYSDPKTTPEQRKEMMAKMSPEDAAQFRGVLADTVQARGRLNEDLRAVDAARKSAPSTWDVAKKALGFDGGQPSQPAAPPSGDRYNMDMASGMGGDVQGGPAEPMQTPAEAMRRSRLNRPQSEDFDFAAGVGGDLPAGEPMDVRSPAGAVRDMAEQARKYRAAGLSY